MLCSPLPAGTQLHVLDHGAWEEVWTRARTTAGMIRVYKAMCRANPSGPPYGMRIVTVHMEHLGRFTGTEWKTENNGAHGPATPKP